MNPAQWELSNILPDFPFLYNKGDDRHIRENLRQQAFEDIAQLLIDRVPQPTLSNCLLEADCNGKIFNYILIFYHFFAPTTIPANTYCVSRIILCNLLNPLFFSFVSVAKVTN